MFARTVFSEPQFSYDRKIEHAKKLNGLNEPVSSLCLKSTVYILLRPSLYVALSSNLISN